MLIVSGVIEIAEADIPKAEEAAIEMMAETAKEPGCLIYEFSQVLGQPGRFRVYEEWDSEAALEAHFAAPHMARFREALGGLEIRSRDVFTIKDGRRAPL